MSKKLVPESLRKIISSHTVPGQYHALFKENAATVLQVVKSKEKKKTRNIQSLHHLIPNIEQSLMQIREDKALKKLFKGIKFTKIEADSKVLTVYYQPNGIKRSQSANPSGTGPSAHSNHAHLFQDDSIRDLESLLYKYLCREIQVKTFSSRLELKRDFLAETLLKVEKELKELNQFCADSKDSSS